MPVKVKICGVKSVESADAAVRAGADYVGMVFHSKSPRVVGLEQAGVLAARLRNRIRIVALFVDADDREIAAAVASVKPDFLQLHGSENLERIAEIRSRNGIPIIKAIRVSEASDLGAAKKYADVSDMLLFDAKAPANASREGGHGVTFDWQLLRGQAFSRPWFLAGGLNVGNVARAIAVSNATGVDVSSGVETAPGIKNPDMICDFVNAARNAHLADAQR